MAFHGPRESYRLLALGSKTLALASFIRKGIAMTRIAAHIVAIAMSLLLVGCGSGKSADPPAAGLNLVAGDSRVTVSWAMTPGVEYWLFYAPSSDITTTNFKTVPGAVVRTSNVVSPFIIRELANGTTYYFTLGGRTDGGPIGSGTPVVSATLRLAGAAWTVGAALGANDLRGIAFGTVGTTFVAVGATGAMFSSPDGMAWTPLTSVVGTDLNAALFNGSTYLAVGAGGAILTSSDAITWQTPNSGTTKDLFGVAGNGAGGFVAVGANGTIVTSSGGTNWIAATSGTIQDLRAVTYANGMFVAVGAAGVVLTSTDATTWTPVASKTVLDLNGVAFGASEFVAIGAAGALVTSPDGATWAAHTITTNALAAVTFGTQFVTVGSNGIVFTSTDGTTWQAQTSGTANALKAIANGNAGYAAVGATGTNLTAY